MNTALVLINTTKLHMDMDDLTGLPLQSSLEKLMAVFAEDGRPAVLKLLQSAGVGLGDRQRLANAVSRFVLGLCSLMRSPCC